MRCKLKNTIKDQIAALEEYVTPIPAVIFYDVVRLRLDPEIKYDKEKTA